MGLGTGHGTTITLGSLGGTYAVRNLQLHDLSAAPVDISHLTTPVPGRVYREPDLYDIGAMDGQLLFDSEVAEPVLRTPDTIRVTLPVRTAGNVAGYWEGQGYFSQWNPGNLESNQEQLASFNIQWLGIPSWTVEQAPPP